MVGFAASRYLDGAVIALIGVDWFRGGRHFALSAYEPEPILGDASE